MSGDLQALGRRAVVCISWRWMPGMLLWETARGSRDRIAGVDATHLQCWSEDFDRGAWVRWLLADANRERTIIPDLSDPATIGCLLQLVREAWGDQMIRLAWDDYTSTWFFRGSVRSTDALVRADRDFRSEAEALVANLECAP